MPAERGSSDDAGGRKRMVSSDGETARAVGAEWIEQKKKGNGYIYEQITN